MKDLTGPLVLLGGGKMGSAMLSGWLRGGLPPALAHVVEPDAARQDELRALGAGTVVASPDGLPEGPAPRALVIAVKPQMMAEALADTTRLAGPGTLILSIAAGKPISSFRAIFGADVPIVRAMPNTPAAIGRGMSVLCADDNVGAGDRALAERMMAAVGETAWIAEEEALHAVTALSGGGPAYVCLLVEAFAAAGVRIGLPEDLAMQLARKTVAGSGALLDASDDSAAQLRRNVTSPGGTTQAALGVLMAEGGLQPLVDRALAAAADRSKALA